MDITNFDSSDITPHLKKFIDDLISITNKIVLKQADIANTYETSSSIMISEYYKQILEGNDTLNNYDVIPYDVYEKILSWKYAGDQYDNDFPIIKYGESKLLMKNLINVCYIGNEDPRTDKFKNIGNINDGYVQILSSKMIMLDMYKLTSLGYEKINGENIDFSNSNIDGKINANDVIVRLNESEYIPLLDLENRYIKDGDNYIYSDEGIYFYSLEYIKYTKQRTFDNYQIRELVNNKNLIPDEYKNDVLESIREYVIDTYINPELSPSSDFSVPRYFGETNKYYRILNGLPSLDNMNNIPNIVMADILPELYSKDDNITKKLYNLTDNEILLLKNNGKYEELVAKYPSADYLKYMGSDRIDVMVARQADKFDILRMGSYEKEYHYDIFIRNFNIAKEYILRRFYHPEIFYSNEYYGNFISYMIVCQALCQSIAHNDSILLNYLYSDEDTVKLRLESYGLNVFDDIPLIYRKNISKYIEKLIMAKGTDSIYPLIIDLFNIDDIEIYRYFYRRIKDENGDIQLSMSQVPVQTKKFITEIVKDINKVDYDIITQNDIYWASYGMPLRIKNPNTGDYELVGDPDQYLKNIIKNTQFNYMNSKYISLNGIFNLSKLNFNASYLMYYILELSKKSNNILLDVDGVDSGQDLFDLMVLLFAIQARRFKYDGNIQHDAVSVAYVLKYNLDGYIYKDGKKITILELYKKYYSEYYYKYLIENYSNNSVQSLIKRVLSIKESDNPNYDIELETPLSLYKDLPFSKYKDSIDGVCDDKDFINNKDINESNNAKLVELQLPNDITIESISETYLYNSGLDGAYDNIIKLREESKDYKEYECYNELLKAIGIARLNNTIFKLSNPEWITIDNFITWNEITDNSLKEMIYNDYIEKNDVDYILCKSHGYPELNLGVDYSTDKKQYCIDISSITNNNYDNNIKIYLKDYIVNESDNIDKYVGYDNKLYVIESVDESDLIKKLSEIDLNIYDNPYCYDKRTGIIYKYLKYARTYLEYLKYENKYLYDIVNYQDDEYIYENGNIVIDEFGNPKIKEYEYYSRISELYINIVNAIDNMIKNDELKNLITSSFNDLNLLTNYIRKVLTVFKSFEIDIVSINIIYNIDNPNEYRIKIIDDISSESNETVYDHMHIINELSISENINQNDMISIYDELNIIEINNKE